MCIYSKLDLSLLLLIVTEIDKLYKLIFVNLLNIRGCLKSPVKYKIVILRDEESRVSGLYCDTSLRSV